MRETAERINELERALRESMNTSAHREALWAQEEGARVQAQRQVYLIFHTLMEDSRHNIDAHSYTQGKSHACLQWQPGPTLKQSAGISSPRTKEDH